MAGRAYIALQSIDAVAVVILIRAAGRVFDVGQAALREGRAVRRPAHDILADARAGNALSFGPLVPSLVTRTVVGAFIPTEGPVSARNCRHCKAEKSKGQPQNGDGGGFQANYSLASACAGRSDDIF